MLLGSYDIRYEIKPLYQFKPMGSFCSTLSRSFLEQKTEDRAKKLIFQRMKKQMQNGGSQNLSNEKNALEMSLSNEIDLKVNEIYCYMEHCFKIFIFF